MKDSFAELDLDRLGFEQLFIAKWIYREHSSSRRKSALVWTVVETVAGLDEWAGAAGLSGTIRSELLRDPSVRILAAHRPDGLCAGAVANRTGPVIGVSNVFTTMRSADEVWAGLADELAAIFPSLPLVGYARGEDLQWAVASDFTEIGVLRVWTGSDQID